MRVFLSNLGCKLNQAELERLAREFVAAGHRIAPSLGEADLHVVNSCTVTHAAARDSRKTARRARRLGAGIRTVLTGCYVESDTEAAAALAGVDLVVPNAAKEELVERVHAAFPEALADATGAAGGAGDAATAADLPYRPLDFGNSRALVKIEDGCNMRCSFCIIPATRGAQRSRPVADVVAEVAALVDGGFPEVVLTGVQISAYRHRGAGLYELVRAILEGTGVGRLRLTSIAPWQFDRRLLDLLAGRRVCRHFHLSLQSGADAVLERMRRPYTAAVFAALLAEIRAAAPAVAVTTDLIVGFPAETEAEHRESLDFAAACGFARLHAFPYSARPGTEAAALPHRLPPPTVRERMRAALAVAAAGRRAFERARLGEVATALLERRDRGRWLGTTDHYLPVAVPGRAGLERRLAPVRLLRRGAGAIEARLDGGVEVEGAGIGGAEIGGAGAGIAGRTVAAAGGERRAVAS